MAIYIEGATKCPICNKVVNLEDKENIIFLDQVAVNLLDPLALFNMSVCHKEHFEQHPLHNAVLQRLMERAQHVDEQVCYISGTAIAIDNYKNPANLIFIDKLVENKSEPLYEYNYRYINKYYLPNWKDKDAFKQLIADLNDSDKWSGKYLDQLLAKLESPIQPAWDARMIEIYKVRFESEAQRSK